MHCRHTLWQLVLHLHQLVVAQVVPKLQHRMLLVVRQGLRPKRSRLRHPQLAIQPNPDWPNFLNLWRLPDLCLKLNETKCFCSTYKASGFELKCPILSRTLSLCIFNIFFFLLTCHFCPFPNKIQKYIRIIHFIRYDHEQSSNKVNWGGVVIYRCDGNELYVLHRSI